MHRRARCPTECPYVPAQNMPEWTVIATQRTSRNVGSECEHGKQKVPGNHRMQALVPGNTLSGGRDLENPSRQTRFTFRAFSEPHQTSSLRMHSIALCCARRPDLEDLLHQLVCVVHSTTALLDMSVGTRRTREMMEGDEERKAGSR